jgi:hypothetical protein
MLHSVVQHEETSKIKPGMPLLMPTYGAGGESNNAMTKELPAAILQASHTYPFMRDVFK